jgi:hypothetical protein
MKDYDLDSKRSELIKELNRMRNLGFFIVDEAFEVAAGMGDEEFLDLPISAIAFVVSEKGYVLYKSKVRAANSLIKA